MVEYNQQHSGYNINNNHTVHHVIFIIITEPLKLQSLTIFTTLNYMQKSREQIFSSLPSFKLLLYHSLENVIADYVLKSSIANC